MNLSEEKGEKMVINKWLILAVVILILIACSLAMNPDPAPFVNGGAGF